MANDRTAAALATRDANTEPGSSLETRIKNYEKWWQAAMPKGGEAAQLVRDAIHCIRTTPKLAECSHDSIIGGLMTCAQLGLRPGVANLGHAWLVPLKGQASLWLGYRGMIELAYRNDRIETITGRVVREGETFRASYEPAALLHEPAGWGAPVGAPLGYYAVAHMARGGIIFSTLDEVEAERIRKDMVRAKGASSPWGEHPEPMKIKTAMRRMWRWLPMSLEMQGVDAIDGSVRLDASPDVRPEEASQVIDSEAVDDNPLHGMTEG